MIHVGLRDVSLGPGQHSTLLLLLLFVTVIVSQEALETAGSCPSLLVTTTV